MKSPDISSLEHTSWRCQCHVVFAPKYQSMEIYREIRVDVGVILRKLCQQKRVEILEANAYPAHTHMLISIPPKAAISPQPDVSLQDAVDRGDRFLQIVLVFDDLITVIKDLFSILGGKNPVFAADQEREAHLTFQRIHHVADAGLRVSQLLGGLGQAPGFYYLNKGAVFGNAHSFSILSAMELFCLFKIDEESGGIGHTAGIFSNDDAHIRYYSERIPVARVLVNQPTPDAWSPATNSLSPAVSEGCGSWGNNILAGNVDYIHLINISKAVLSLDVELPNGDELFKD